MKAYIIRRLLLIIPTFIGITLVTFLVVQLAPGSPVMERLRQAESMGGGAGATALSEQEIDQIKALYGLDKPIHKRYLIWLGQMLTFDFGTSYKHQQPVLTVIAQKLPITLELNILSILLVYLLAVPIGVYSAVRQNSISDHIVTIVLFILYSLPNFWVGMLLLVFFASGEYFDWFPSRGAHSFRADELPFWPWLADHLWHLVLPIVVYSYAGLAAISRYMRTGMLDTIRQDYIRTARAYGFAEKTVIFKYAMRNSLLPVITLFATLLPALFAGSVIVETIFSIDGMGRLMFEALKQRNYPLIMGGLSITALLTLAGMLLTDLLYAAVDPRIRYE